MVERVVVPTTIIFLLKRTLPLKRLNPVKVELEIIPLSTPVDVPFTIVVTGVGEAPRKAKKGAWGVEVPLTPSLPSRPFSPAGPGAGKNFVIYVTVLVETYTMLGCKNGDVVEVIGDEEIPFLVDVATTKVLLPKIPKRTLL